MFCAVLTAQALHRILEQKLHGVEWKHTTAHTDQLVSTLVKRLNEASDIYQMFGVLGDVVLLHGYLMQIKMFHGG